MNPGLPGFRQFLVVLAEPSAPAEPGQRAFNHPSARQHLKLVAVRSTAHHLQQLSSSLPSPRHQPTGIGRIGPDDLEPGEPAQQLGQHQSDPVPVLDVGGVNHHGQEQPGGVHYNVALAPGHLFTGVLAARPPFSVVLTDWLSMMAALGVASRPSLSRTMGGSASKTRSQVPSLRHFRKYHQTVPQGGRSWGIIRQEIPPRTTYRMPFTTSRKCTLPQVHGSRMSPERNRGQQGFQQAPLGIGQISGIRSLIRIPKLQTTRKPYQAVPMQVSTIVTHPLSEGVGSEQAAKPSSATEVISRSFAMPGYPIDVDILSFTAC